MSQTLFFRQERVESQELLENLAFGQIANKTAETARAESASHRASDLGTYARGPVRAIVAQQDALDASPVPPLDQEFFRSVVGERLGHDAPFVKGIVGIEKVRFDEILSSVADDPWSKTQIGDFRRRKNLGQTRPNVFGQIAHRGKTIGLARKNPATNLPRAVGGESQRFKKVDQFAFIERQQRARGLVQFSLQLVKGSRVCPSFRRRRSARAPNP